MRLCKILLTAQYLTCSKKADRESLRNIDMGAKPYSEPRKNFPAKEK